jgi:nucleotide-binding universal stress UspA family protein
VHLAHVHHFDYAADFVAPAPPIVPFSFMPYEQDGERSVARELTALAREYGVSSANCHVLGGAPPFDEICRLAQTISADLIVMPTHGYTGLKHVFLEAWQNALFSTRLVRASGAQEKENQNRADV